MLTHVKLFIKRYRDDLFVIAAGAGMLYFATLDRDLGWFWNTAGFIILIWGIATLCMNLRSGENQKQNGSNADA
ncbi:MAG: hypothetical protein CME31_08285 [Gimesia sp.]|jgi:hypothetical protein|uniref:Uncharacterized protein n=1 Tax=Gimesia maris TaxID=122 RepID=A0A3D3RCK7_9PLAN|nr:hypothetical protein [Gimesia sp.]HCO25838.1 hypothetical protein [Gimesia maris]|tara:strand:+ start:57576 stop:57797 length:222 start_codon:yes stop_codon:yes gene_type:complete